MSGNDLRKTSTPPPPLSRLDAEHQFSKSVVLYVFRCTRYRRCRSCQPLCRLAEVTEELVVVHHWSLHAIHFWWHQGANPPSHTPKWCQRCNTGAVTMFPLRPMQCIGPSRAPSMVLTIRSNTLLHQRCRFTVATAAHIDPPTPFFFWEPSCLPSDKIPHKTAAGNSSWQIQMAATLLKIPGGENLLCLISKCVEF